MGLMLPILLPTVALGFLAEIFSVPLEILDEISAALQILAMNLFG